MKRKTIFALIAVSALAVLAGCGRLPYELKAKDLAQRYVNKKYGFSADITKVSMTENGWLEFVWEAPLFAHVGMSYGGTEFTVLVPIRENDPDSICDNYEADIICGQIEEYVKEMLGCEELALRADYGNAYGTRLLPAGIRSAEDLRASKNAKNISVFVHGTQAEAAEKLDPGFLGENTNFSIVEWDGEEFPEIPYGLIRELPCRCGWGVNALHYTQNDGSWVHMGFDRFVTDNVCLVMPSACHITMEKSEGPDQSGDIPVTDWYSMSGSGEGYGAFYAAAGASAEEEYCIEYESGGKAYYERMPHTDGDDPVYELYCHRYCDGKDRIQLFRVVKRDHRDNYR